jgi:hypothetical protein
MKHTYTITNKNDELFFVYLNGEFIGNRSTVVQAECRIREHAKTNEIKRYHVRYADGTLTGNLPPFKASETDGCGGTCKL